MDYYNLKPDKSGWYIESIQTDKQKGSVNEFIEKEGKWFNYIRGNVNDIKTSDLSFQGLGIIKNIRSTPDGNVGSNSGGGDGSAANNNGNTNGINGSTAGSNGTGGTGGTGGGNGY